MKTENMKTTMKQLAAGTIAVFLLLAGNVYAKGSQTKASSHETIEATLQLEKWMTDDVIWNSKSTEFTLFENEPEMGLSLEAWMTNPVNWGTYFIDQENDSEMVLENWMTDDDVWKFQNFRDEVALKVEGWMTNNNVWL